MADDRVNQNVNAPQSGPPPAGGGPFRNDPNNPNSSNQKPNIPDPSTDQNKKRDEYLKRWNETVLTAAENLDRRWVLETEVLGPAGYRSLATNRQRLQRRQLEELTIARKLFLVLNGRLPAGANELNGFFRSNRAGIENIWDRQRATTPDTGIPVRMGNNYTIAQTKEWLASQALFGLGDKTIPKPISSDDLNKKSEETSLANKTEESKKSAKKTEQKFVQRSANAYSRIYPQSVPSGPGENTDEDLDEEEYYEQQAESLQTPSQVGNTLASAARVGGKSSTKSEQLSKRGKQRKRGKQKELKAKVSTESNASATSGITETQGQVGYNIEEEESVKGFEKPSVDIEAEEDVTAKIKPKVSVEAKAEVKTEAIEDDSLTPGFAETKDEKSQAEMGFEASLRAKAGKGGSLETGLEAEVVQDNSLTPGFTPSKGEQKGVKVKGEATVQQETQVSEAAEQTPNQATSNDSGAGQQQVVEDNVTGEKTENLQQGKAQDFDSEQIGEQDVADSSSTGKPKPKKASSFLGAGFEGEEEPVNDSYIGPGVDTDAQKKFGQNPGLASSGGDSGLDENDFAAKQASGANLKPKEARDNLKKDKQAQQADTVTKPSQQTKTTDSGYIAPGLAPGEEKRLQQSMMGAGVVGDVAADKNINLPDEEGAGENEEDQDDEEDEDEDEGSGPQMSAQQILNAYNALSAGEQNTLLNKWLGKNSVRKKKKLSPLSAWKMNILESAALRYPELKEILEKIKVEVYKEAKGINDDAEKGKKSEKDSDIDSQLMYWAKRVGMEYIIKWYVFPYASISAFYDAGIEAVIAFILLDIYWIISNFTESPYFQGLVKWQKALIIGVNIVLILLFFALITILVFGYCLTQVTNLTSSPDYCSSINSYLPSLITTVIKGGL